MQYEVQVTTTGLAITNKDELVKAVALAKQLNDAIDEFKNSLKENMELENISEFECDILKAQFIQKKDTESFDTKTFAKENPELYAKYVSIKKNKPAFRVDFKGE